MVRHDINGNIMKKNQILLLSVLSFLPLLSLRAQERVAQWSRFEASYKYHTPQNPFTDVELSAMFIHDATADTIRVCGFYDGDDTFRVRFMPTKLGRWRYVTTSGVAELNGKRGEIECTAPAAGEHGMVQVGPDQSFCYADGLRYDPVGTTSYAWIHASEARQQLTLQSLGKAGFNKLRFCVFPNNSVNELPSLYPFKLLSSQKDSTGHTRYVWDYSRFDPKFFQHLEKCIDELKQIGVEADLILFTPYDEGRWGFDRMTQETNMRYLRYVVSRLASFSNLWWSMANEWDLVKAKTLDDWLCMSRYVHEADPYHHLLSIHGGTATYINYALPYFTHASIQDQGPLYNKEGAATVRNIIHKPIIFDEVCYEGDHSARWAQLTGQEMLQRMWTGLMAGTYVTHGECFTVGKDHYTGYSFLATGGEFQGTSPSRVRFMRDLLSSLPYAPRLADRSWDGLTASAGPDTWLVYFGADAPKQWKFSLPAKNDHFSRLKGGERFTVDVIDTWNQTVKHLPDVYTVEPAPAKRMVDKDGRRVALPGKPNILLRIQRLK